MRWKISSRDAGRFKVRLLLDTAILIYAVEAPERLRKRVAAALENPGNVLELSAISITEISSKASLGKMKLTAAMSRHTVDELDFRLPAGARDQMLVLFQIPAPRR